ncbi:MAG: hypothetical protein AB7G11_03310 [Phycisphaerales bacterium]
MHHRITHLLSGLVLAPLFFGCAVTSSSTSQRTPAPRSSPPALHAIDRSRPIESLIDPVNGVNQGVITGVHLRGDAPASLTMRLANLCEHTYITAKAAREMGATYVGEVTLEPWDSPASAVRSSPGGAPQVVPSPALAPDASRWNEARAVAITGANPTGQRRFTIVRIDQVDLGVGPPFGPVDALVLDDANASFGLLGRSWLAHHDGADGFIIAPDRLYWGRLRLTDGTSP